MAEQTFDLLATTTLTSGTTQISLTNIPNTYKSLRVTVSANYTTSNREDFDVRMNNLTSGYDFIRLFSEINSVFAFDNSDQSSWTAGQPQGPFSVTMDFLNYADTNQYKVALGLSQEPIEGNRFLAWEKRTTSAISSLQFSSTNNKTFANGTTISIWGLIG